MEHKDIPDAYLHEVKGAASATAGKVLTATGLGTATFQTPTVYSNVEIGWYDYNDLATTSSPIALSVAGTYYDLTNDKAGAYTQIAYGLVGVTDIWNSGTSRFDWSGLTVGDVLCMRVDLTVTTGSANTAIDLALEMAIGDALNFDIPVVIQKNFKTAGTYRVIGEVSFYIGSTAVKNSPAKLKIKADSTGASVVVNGWYTSIAKRG